LNILNKFAFFEFTAARTVLCGGQGLFQQPGLLLFLGERVAGGIKHSHIAQITLFSKLNPNFQEKATAESALVFFDVR
jgi:hypothetical protein